MSIVINLKSNSNRPNMPTIPTENEVENERNARNSDGEYKMETDKSLINIPKYIRANSNDLNKKNEVINSSTKSKGNSIDVNIVENSSKLDQSSVRDFINNTNLENSIVWDKKNTLNTFTDRTIFEVYKEEEDKFNDNMR